jgi:hypothetical protein
MKPEEFRKRKPEEFRKRKERFEKQIKRHLTDEEFERRLRGERKIRQILMPILLTMGLAILADWPGPWAPGAESVAKFMGLVLVAFGVFWIKEFL